jgi:hypothetical protein
VCVCTSGTVPVKHSGTLSQHTQKKIPSSFLGEHRLGRKGGFFRWGEGKTDGNICSAFLFYFLPHLCVHIAALEKFFSSEIYLFFFFSLVYNNEKFSL